jgi:hypothetical protein
MQHRPQHPPATLVWIDSREAILTRWDGRSVRQYRIESEVPGHRRSTGQLSHDPSVRPGGGGGADATGEPHRLEHLTRFIDEVAGRIPANDRLALTGPGTVRERLEKVVTAEDRKHRRSRPVSSEALPQQTPEQLKARLRDLAGVPPRRVR